MNLDTPVSALTRVGKTTTRHLSRLGIATAGDLLYWFPFRYEDFSRTAKISDLREGDSVTVRGKIELIGNKRSWKRGKNITECLVSDDTGSLRVIWFGQPFLIKNLQPGDEVFLSGKVKVDMLGPQLASPSYEKTNKNAIAHPARLVSIYPTTDGLTQKQIRFLISQVVDLAKNIPEWVPDNILDSADLIPLADALRGIHFPVDDKDLHAATERLKFDELFLLQLQAEKSRLELTKKNAPVLKFFENEIKDFVAGLPFTLTKTQKISAWEILQDLGRLYPMNRMLSGDVGSGKTVVAALALYDTVLNGYQAVFMAPTEILAMQHYQTLSKILGNKIKIGLLTNSQQIVPGGIIEEGWSLAKKKKQIADQINSGDLQVAIGTHALLSDKIEFTKLGLVIVDEQHRFGVEQRKTIKSKGEHAHFLSMTATPIPRSLALTLYGDLELSAITELPTGRKKILTRLVEAAKRSAAYDFIRAQVKNGRQVFVVCPLIEEKDVDGDAFVPINYFTDNDKKTVMSEYEKLSQKIFPDLRVGYLHGKLPAKGGSAFGRKSPNKTQIMEDFKNGKIDVLVATSVVEVGVDIPNASVMMIEGAERFGLAQLHQFRGRVGRSVHQSYCFLFTNMNGQKIMERLRFFEANHDGFRLAEKDLELRGPGEVYGTTQSGMMNLRLAKLTDIAIVKKAREAAKIVVGDFERYPACRARFKKFAQNVHLE
ncbi:MAG: ATP-dependent DNA helicase RecG [Candidatus Magasanikbacteria bacterium RIFOXYA2_FULL_44_8]|uniref:ATP-dependent DNA helicase RecG n=1 Tax=Candidatus Magasanikbacteria bacterium RIFOXYA2_FULL_44_8 TaxID=1798696 RepID=A0A1F6NKR3_9BACT|nr:MAG: ATP-dependent DNA helicase RecG [Candidatus Magasanikbacteria bacterium RIFOXYA2_FULL_44_8]